MSSGQKSSSTPFVLGVVGSAGGFLSLAAWAFLFYELSPSLHGENAPLYSPEQILILASQGISSALGLAGAILSKTSIRKGGIAMLVAAGVALASLSGLFSGGLSFILLVPVYGWWAIVLLLGGLSGAMMTPQESNRGASNGSIAPT